MDPTTNALLLGASLTLSIYLAAERLISHATRRRASAPHHQSFGAATAELCIALTHEHPDWESVEIERDGDAGAKVNIRVRGGGAIPIPTPSRGNGHFVL